MAVQIQLRNDTAANWTAANPVLAAGEMGVETDTDQFKLGDGTTAWTLLAYGGIQGESAYEVAVNNGFVGNEAAWLASLEGADGANGADGVDGGFDSTQTIETKSANYTLTSADAGKLILNSAAITITVEGLSVGEQVDFLQNTADQITFAEGVGMTLNSKDDNLKTSAQYSPASVKCIATDTYVLIGDLGA
jgi:hypothetical protein